MGFFEDLAKGGTEGVFSGFAKAVQVFKADPTKVAELENAASLARLQHEGLMAELQLKAATLEADLAKAQIDVNKIEAANTRFFVSGWRPAVGWVCVSGISYEWLFRPIVQSLINYWQATYVMVSLDTEDIYTLLGGMLGLGVLRTVEKLKIGGK